MTDGDTDSDEVQPLLLKGIARDRHVETSSGDQSQVGVVNAKDIISVVVNGITAVAAVDANDDNEITGDEVPAGSGPYFSVDSLGAGSGSDEILPEAALKRLRCTGFSRRTLMKA